jgi:predicted metal-binding membrane protein
MNKPTDAVGVLEQVLRRDRAVVTLLLVTVTAASWVYLLAGVGMEMDPRHMSMLIPSQSGMAHMLMAPAAWSSAYALLMFLMWWLMMIAMMLPSAAPVALLHAGLTRQGLARATSAFIAGYLVMWGAFSLVAAIAQWALERAGLLSAMMMSTSGLLGAGLLLAAGVWQLTPLKAACLRHCRSPLSFLSGNWRPGIGGAFRMGAVHGTYCLGCCWFLMALMFYAGVMNLIWTIGLALFVLAEKLLPAGVAFGRISGLLLIAAGAWLGISAL